MLERINCESGIDFAREAPTEKEEGKAMTRIKPTPASALLIGLLLGEKRKRKKRKREKEEEQTGRNLYSIEQHEEVALFVQSSIEFARLSPAKRVPKIDRPAMIYIARRLVKFAALTISFAR